MVNNINISSPYVSVIIPNYNHAKYLDQRIQSVLDQTYQNFEVIILDDKSTDNSREVIEKYRSNPHVSNIEYNEENSGSTFKQWHKGFGLAKGELIWIAESDDYCTIDFLERLVDQYLINPNVVLLFYTTQFVDSHGCLMEPIALDLRRVKLFDGRDFIMQEMRTGTVICNASSAIFKKSTALSIDPQYMNYVAAGDRLFWIELSEKGHVVWIDSPKNYMRQHESKLSPRKLRDGTTFYEDYRIYRYLRAKGYIAFYNSVSIREVYLKKIENTKFDSINIKNKVYSLWSKNGLFNSFIMFVKNRFRY